MFNNSNLAYNSNGYYEEEAHLQTTLQLEGFDGLWQATELSLPSYETFAAQNADVLPINDLAEQLLYLTDEVNILRRENLDLREEMADLLKNSQVYDKLAEDYGYIIQLNRTLTKQLNQVMTQREKEKSQIKALRALLD